MARQKGTFDLNSNIEPNISAPLDSRSIVPTLEDLTNNNFDYAYVGMMVVVQDTKDLYVLKDNDTSNIDNWKKIGSDIATDDLVKYSAIGEEFDVNIEYHKDDKVMYKGELYVFNKTHIGVWNAEDVDKSNVDTLIPEPLTEDQMQDIKDSFKVDPVYFAANPTGCIIQMLGNSAPGGYLACDGSIYNISDYPLLAAYFEEQFGSKNYFGGNGTTTFGIPDLRGEFLRGTGTNSHANQGNGSSVGTHQDATKLPIYAFDGSKFAIFDNGTYNYPKGIDSVIDTTTTRRNFSSSGTVTVSNIESTVTTRPTNTSVLYCIKY